MRVASTLSDALSELGALGDGLAHPIMAAGQVAPVLVMPASSWLSSVSLRHEPRPRTPSRSTSDRSVVGDRAAAAWPGVRFLRFVFICANHGARRLAGRSSTPTAATRVPDATDTSGGAPIGERVRHALRGLVVRQAGRDAAGPKADGL